MSVNSRRHKVTGDFAKALELARRLPRILANRRLLRLCMGTVLGLSEEGITRDCDLTAMSVVDLASLVTGIEEGTRLNLALFAESVASICPLEALSLAILLRRVRAKRVFEFGTYLGLSTFQLALNTGSDGRVFTLDLPEDDPRYTLSIPDPYEKQLVGVRNKGKLVGEEVRSRVVFLRQDSAEFDDGPYGGSMDAVFVDGAHSADYVRNDSEKGWRMLRPGGVIAWHDCRPPNPDVVRFLLGSSYAPRRIRHTSLAFAEKPGTAV